VELYLNSPIRLHDIVFNYKDTGTSFLFFLKYLGLFNYVYLQTGNINSVFTVFHPERCVT
jgi:hypothetical protein